MAELLQKFGQKIKTGLPHNGSEDREKGLLERSEQ